jgi:FkbM family methyltransferase
LLINAAVISRIWSIKPNGVIHIGAHQAEEMREYSDLNWGHMYWVEANPKLAQNLIRNLNSSQNTVIECAAWDVDNLVMKFHETTDTQSSSILPLKKHSLYYPAIQTKIQYKVQARRIDCLFDSPPPFSFANIDIQGAELQAIKGMGELIRSLDAIYSEVNREELYEGCANVKEIDEYLQQFNFERVATRWILRKGWGDALYINKGKIKITEFSKITNLSQALLFYARQVPRLILDQVGILNFMRKSLRALVII